MNYCSHCGSANIQRVVPIGDIGLRYACASCEAVHYQNPNIVAGCIAVRDDRVLLCRRAIEPSRGLWTVPAGYMEMGETIEEAVMRETLEEAHARLEGELRLFALYNLPTFGEVYVILEGRLADPIVSPGSESLEVRLFAPTEIPWESMAFPMVREALQTWANVRHRENSVVHQADFLWGPEGAVRVRRRASPRAQTMEALDPAAGLSAKCS